MNIADENMEWKKEAPHLASLPKHQPYGVPNNYFNNLSNHINQAVFVAGLPHKEKQGFTVPENYFETLAAQVQLEIAMPKIDFKTEGFTTPENYFETLASKIIAKTTPKPTKTLSLWTSNASKYAAAACVILISAVVLLVNQQSNISTTNNNELANEQLLYGIDESVIIEHLQENNNSNPTEDQDLENYILNNLSTRDLSNNL